MSRIVDECDSHYDRRLRRTKFYEWMGMARLYGIGRDYANYMTKRRHWRQWRFQHQRMAQMREFKATAQFRHQSRIFYSWHHIYDTRSHTRERCFTLWRNLFISLQRIRQWRLKRILTNWQGEVRRCKAFDAKCEEYQVSCLNVQLLSSHWRVWSHQLFQRQLIERGLSWRR